MKLSIIIVNYNVKYFLEVCLHSVYRAIAHLDAEVLVVDNNSKDGSCAYIKQQYPQTILIANTENAGFSKANNQAVAIAKGEYILFLNPDTVMPEDFFEQTLPFMDAHPEVGALGPRLIDGKGAFAPDSKKSFPSLAVAIFKTTGISKIFKRSPYFNSYYAVHIQEMEQAPVDVLSGCCMLVRHSVIREVGGAFDEDYFMYCEDVDLSYRIQKAGYQNIYFPKATLIHYKGESTKKATLSYVRIFNEALITFVKKNYSKQSAGLFIAFIKVGILLRGILGFFKNSLSLFKMPLLDAVFLGAVLFGTNWFWVEYIKKLPAIHSDVILATYPAYIAIWLAALYLNGAYDNPYRGLRVIRGMLIGLLFVLAYYSILPVHLRYSRAVIFYSSGIGALGLVFLHKILRSLGILKFVNYDDVPRKAALVCDTDEYPALVAQLEKLNYTPEILGRVSYSEQSPGNAGALSTVQDTKPVLYATGIKELIFNVNEHLSYKTILEQMQVNGAACDYKIHVPNSSSFVGSSSSNTSGDLYTIDSVYRIATFAEQRNKRVFDIVAALTLLLCFPVSFLLVQDRAGLIANCIHVLAGRKTWIGYSSREAINSLPKIKESILPNYFMSRDGYKPKPSVLLEIDKKYAGNYTAGIDYNCLIKNIKFSGKKI